MKKLLLLLLPVLFLAACKDDDEDSPGPIPPGEVSHTLQGKWTNDFIKREYYSDADTIIYADSVNLQAFFEFKGNRMMISTPDNPTQEVWTYDLPDQSSPNYITFKRNGQTTDYTIVSITDSSMVWTDEEAWAGYPIDADDNDKKTSKVGKYTYRFSRTE